MFSKDQILKVIRFLKIRIQLEFNYGQVQSIWSTVPELKLKIEVDLFELSESEIEILRVIEQMIIGYFCI